MSSAMRQLPAVHQLLDDPALGPAIADFGRPAVTEAVRAVVADARTALASDHAVDVTGLVGQAIARLRARPRLRRVINATGVLLHTNLGRAPLAEAATEAIAEAARNYVNLELDLTTGQRSHRHDIVREELMALLGAEAATAVNTCAAATVLTLRALATAREVVVARGELVEIGGGFRIPDIMAASGATLREVGTTNITRLADYEAAIGPNTALLMRVHQSNFRVRGFTASPSLEQLIELGRRRGLPVVDDIGSGAIVDYAQFGVTGEPLAARSLAAGADLVLFSADKLLGGPQAGIIAGRTSLLSKIEKEPFYRAVRPCKLTLAGLAATLQLYRRSEASRVPVVRQLMTPLEVLRQRAESLAAAIGGRVSDDVTYVGGGSCPDEAIPTVVVVIDGPAEELARRLRTGEPAVMARIRDDHVVFDLRSIFPEQLDELAVAVGAAQITANG